MVVPQIIHFNRDFHSKSYKSSILGCFPIFGNTHMFPHGFASNHHPSWKSPRILSPHGNKRLSLAAYAASTEDLATEIQAPRMSVALVAENVGCLFFFVWLAIVTQGTYRKFKLQNSLLVFNVKYICILIGLHIFLCYAYKFTWYFIFAKC